MRLILLILIVANSVLLGWSLHETLDPSYTVFLPGDCMESEPDAEEQSL